MPVDPPDQDECFNPRPRAGGDRAIREPPSPKSCFNPRPRAGGDQTAAVDMLMRTRVSIHAPARGATIVGGVVLA